jgi:hypothetical protein
MGKPYKFVEPMGYEYHSNITGRRFFAEWLNVFQSGFIKIPANYAWDGCSPKFKVLQQIFGSPDGAMNPNTGKPFTYEASLIHDALYQYKNEVPITRYEADRLFYDMLKEQGFIWARTYYVVVRLGGWIYGRWNGRRNTNEAS